MLKMPTELTHDQANACLRGWRSQLPMGDGPVLVDVQPLHHFDSSALAVLLELHRQVKSLQRDLVLQGASSRLRALAALYGVDELLAI